MASPDRIKLPLAVFVAILLHGLIISSVAIFYRPAKPKPAAKLEVVWHTPTPTPAPTPTPTPPGFEIGNKSTPTPTPTLLPEKDEQLLKELFAQLPPEKQREYVDVEGLAKKKNTSKEALLESWRDSVAASRKRGTGSDPLPTLDGLENMEFRHLTNSAESIGKPQNPPESANATPPPAQGEMPSLFKPKPVDPKTQDPNATPETAVAATPTPPPTPTPILVAKATPPPNILSVIEAAADQIPIFLNRRSDPNRPKAMANQQPEPDPTPTPTPRPTATPPPKPTPTDTSRPKPTLLPTPTPQDSQSKAPTRPQSVIVATKLDFKNNQPRPVPNPGYSPQMRRTKVNGAEMPEGEDGVDSVATPLGRYKKSVSSAVGSRWNYYIRQRMSLLQTGKITAVFSLDARGKVRSFRIEENTSNRAHAALIEQAVREAEFDPPPPEAMRNGAFEYPMSFHLL